MAQRLLLALACVLLAQLSGCSRLFFYPQKQLLRTPAEIGLEFEEVVFPSSDGTRLHGWFLPAPSGARGSLLFLHGNAENISTHLGAVYWLPKQGFNVFLFDYRGFGRSEGEADIVGAHLDAAAALRYLAGRQEVDPNRLVVFGQSIGGAVALYTAATTDVSIRAVVAESAFASYPGIMREKMSEALLTWPLQWIAYGVTSRYDPIRVIRQIPPASLLLIHGDQDTIIPVEESRRLYAAAAGDKALWIVPGGGHISAFAPGVPESSAYRSRLVAFLRRVLGPE